MTHKISMILCFTSHKKRDRHLPLHPRQDDAGTLGGFREGG